MPPAFPVVNVFRGLSRAVCGTVLYWSIDAAVPNNKNGYTVTFAVNGGTISSEWINEYGIWRIKAFGDFASGDKSLVEKREQADKDARRLRTNYDLQLSVGLAYMLGTGPAFGADIKFRFGYVGSGLRLYTAGGKILPG